MTTDLKVSGAPAATGLSEGREINPVLVLAIAQERASGRHAYQIAAAAGAHPSELSRWLNGRCQPGPVQAVRLAEVLGIAVEEIFPDVAAELDENRRPRKERNPS